MLAAEELLAKKEKIPNPPQKQQIPKDLQDLDELSGSLDFQFLEDKLMHSVLENDQEVIEDASIIKESLNNSLFGFTPDLMMEQFVKNYRMAKQLYGPKLIRFMTGYDAEYIEKNIRIPEFQRELEKKLGEKIEELKEKGLIDDNGTITEKGVELAALELYIEELDKLDAYKFLGDKVLEKQEHYGTPFTVRPYRKGDRYKDISVRRSIKTAVRRKHDKLSLDDVQVFTRKAKGKVSLIYALDASGSMKGPKIATCKKAGVALVYKALQEKDEVGLVVFGQKVQKAIPPCSDFGLLLKEMTKILASKETDLAACILKSIELFPDHHGTKHLLLLTDAMPTVGDDPVAAAYDAATQAAAAGISVSVIGIQLDENASQFAEKLVAIGNGKLYLVQQLDDLDKIVLTDYFAAK